MRGGVLGRPDCESIHTVRNIRCELGDEVVFGHYRDSEAAAGRPSQ
jgi:hypothetical protein